MKLSSSLVCTLLALGGLHLSTAIASESSEVLGYYRAPALSGNTLVFTAEGDLWTKRMDRVQAQRLTSLPAEEIGATISKDGQWVAYVANYDGASEVYVIPIAGGQAKRISFENSRVRVQGWTATGEVLYATDNAFGPANYWVLRTVNPDTLETQDLPLADAIEGVIDDKGEYLYFTRFGLQTTGDNVKVYRGGAKGELWRYKLNSNKEAQRLTSAHKGSVRQPMLWNNRLFFVSDGDGNDNFWSMALDGTDIQQVTQYKEWQVRGARIHKGQIVFQQGADIKLLDFSHNEARTLDIELVSDFTQRRAHWVNSPMKYATSTQLSPKGDKVVITARSHVAIATTDGSRLVELALPGNSRISRAVLSPDGRWVYGISDASGEQEIWRFPADGSQGAKQLTKDGTTLRMDIKLSPDGRYIASDDYNGDLWLLDLNKNRNKKIITQGEGLGPYADIVWSADSQFIAITKSELGKPRPQIVLYSLDENRSETLTSDKYESYSPTFSGDGKWLYFLSDRQFIATPTSPWGDRNMGPMFDKRTEIFALALDKSANFPFRQPNELTKSVEGNAQDKKADKIKVKLDWNGIAQRLWQVPVASGNYSNLQANDNSLYFIEQVPGRSSVPSLKVVKFDPLDPKVETYAEDVGRYDLSADGQKLFIRKHSNNGQDMLIVDAVDKLPKELNHAKVQTNQWQLAIEPELEWQQMFEDAWLMHRDSFFDKQMRGLDWQATKRKYQPLVDRLTDRHELNDIFKQMMGELDSLHSQVRGGDLPRDSEMAKAASLGARLAQTKAGVKITHIYANDPELPSNAAPLAQIGVDAEIGDIIVSINGKSIANQADVTRFLTNQANKQILLTLKRGNKQHKTIVKPVSIRSDAKLRYLDWVNANSNKVSEASDGKIGYLHLYAMGSGDVASFAREFYANYEKEGLVIDVRRNRGGNIDSWIIEKLLRRTWAFWQPTRGTPNANMQQTFRGHLVVLTDQLTYSDGETFSAGIKALGIAPLIGKQTTGAGVWLSGRNSLTDKGIARVAEYPQYAMDGRWILEGRGVSPDIEVDNLPYATFTGHDAQLEKAISYLKEELVQQPVLPLKAQSIPAKGMALDIK
ncbi:PDZ domain-containing protein [Shewanella sp. D64]|uniref:S41 family peptidase n=1 Tax=unclassified Shewanella TaxID=196818 RepID=UPI0022BA6AA9|nr:MULTISPECIES: S41 family peptidase [unclassified Shewanella]MEC4727020.1 PDZ domain-containing protein [Shewanella sp. D64]MEC4737759.1 PDZ domain-containing protein [Shewanella sp. E94]WBJ93980.1 PDZ domain-containing protein [Shewanella sp. MTB7]